MLFQDTVTLGDVRVNDAGYLETFAHTARVGIQQYRGVEAGRPDLAMVNVYRDEAEVFAKTSLDTFSKIPVTVDHPPETVNAGNWKKYAVGTTGEEVLRDGERLKIGLKITDQAAVNAVKAGKRELSVGYVTELVWEDGKAPDGTPYQARQTKIVADHIAIVSAGRAGPQCRIGDSWADFNPTPEKDPPMTLKTVTVDGIPIEVTDQGATVIATLQQRLSDAQTKLTNAEAAHTTAITAKDEEIGTLKVDLQNAKDAAPKPGDLDKLVADRAALVTTVKAIDSKIDEAGKSDADLRKAAVSSKLGDAMVKDASDAEIAGMFKAIAKDVKPTDPFRQVVQSGVQTADGSDLTALRDKAKADRLDYLSNAHRQTAA